MHETYSQRMRVTFSTDDSVKWVGHLDFARSWERAIRRAGLPLAYSRGFNAQARLHFAAALPVGFTGQAELVDVFLDAELSPAEFMTRFQRALPAGITLRAAEPVERQRPSMQSQLLTADYRVDLAFAGGEDALQTLLAEFTGRAEAWRERQRGDKPPVRYDLRPLVQSLRGGGMGDLGPTFEVTMLASAGANGRPDELLAEMGLAELPRRIARIGLHLQEWPPAPTE